MTQPKHAQDSFADRAYTIGDEKYPSVTTICGVVAKPALPAWAAKLAAERAMKHAGIWQAMEEEEGFEEARKWISKASREYTDQKATIGSAVHKMCETRGDCDLLPYLSKLPGDMAAQRINIENHYAQYEQFLAEHSPDILVQELTVFHESMKYAGTLDMVCVIDGRIAVLDIKTGNAAQYKTTWMQLAAYKNATHVLNDDGTVEPFTHKCECGYVLELKPRSYKLTEVDVGDETFAAFALALGLRRWMDA